MIQLSQNVQIAGILALINIIIVLFWGIIVLKKFLYYRERLLLWFFFTIIFTISPWFSNGFGYLLWLITGNILSYEVTILMSNLGLPIAIFSWVYIYTSLIFPNRKKFILSCYAILSILFYIYVFYYLYFVPNAPLESMLGIQEDPNGVNSQGFPLLFMIISILTSTITGIHFSIVSIKSKDLKTKWTGRFLLLSFLIFGIAVIGIVIIEQTFIPLILFRIFVILSGTFFYFGFIMPKWLQKTLNINEIA